MLIASSPTPILFAASLLLTKRNVYHSNKLHVTTQSARCKLELYLIFVHCARRFIFPIVGDANKVVCDNFHNLNLPPPL